MYTRARIFLFLVLLLFSLMMGVSSGGERVAPPAKDISGIDFRDGLLRVSVEKQNFRRVMDEVAQKAGIGIVINGLTDEDLTLDFDYLSVEEALKKLLRGRNYVFFYHLEEGADLEHSHRLVKVLVFPKSGGWTMVGLGEITENRSTEKAQQRVAFKEVLSLNRERMGGASKGVSQEEGTSQSVSEGEGTSKSVSQGEGTSKSVSQGEGGLAEAFRDALERLPHASGGLKEMEGLVESLPIEMEVSQGSSESSGDPMDIKRLHEVLEATRNLEKLIMPNQEESR